ncbi:response regulator transcription factor [Petralouisia muris]|uniref:Response regulator transcription factor n=1 Tax=Petralouisia muris TaxID=3032872 RepID=A0AC61RV91_9FIRM|nr:LytTR family DNA-binding domain-containing protein [Petralouisia muris]TGY95590.1 response regulator transcription factor [Petralouisia muris]
MNIAICDDEKYVRSFIRKLIERQGLDCEIREFSSGEELLQSQGLDSGRRKFSSEEELLQSQELMGNTGEISSQKEHPEAIDILFLDISMEDIDGITVAKQLRKQAGEQGKAVWGSLPLLIFVTGYPEYVMEAFAVHAYQFLVKPVDEKEFAAVFEQAVQECRILKGRKQETPKELLIHKGNTTRKVLEEDIYYVESSNRKVILCLNCEKIIYYGKISRLEEELPENFFRVHKGYLVNMKYVERYSRTEVWMKNGDKLLISRYKYQEFVKAYLKYISEGNH